MKVHLRSSHVLRQSTHEYPGTKEKIAPRAGTNSLWNKELKDIISRCRLTYIVDQGVPPNKESFRGGGSAASDYQIDHVHQQNHRMWQEQNTHLFYIVDASITLKGPYLEADLRLIEVSTPYGRHARWGRLLAVGGSIIQAGCVEARNVKYK